MAVHFTLVVVPNCAARLRKRCLDRQHEPHLLWLENATSRIDEGSALALKGKTWFEVGRREVVVYFPEASDGLASCHSHERFAFMIG
jgi:hypothetical protein